MENWEWTPKNGRDPTEEDPEKSLQKFQNYTENNNSVC